MNNLTDARYCAGMYVNLLGFCLEESKENYLSPDKYKEITDWISGISFVGEFENSHPDTILQKLTLYPGISVIELSEASHIPMLLHTELDIIYRVQVSSATDVIQLIAETSSFQTHQIRILLVSENDSLDEETLKAIKDLATRTQVLLGYGLQADSIENILKHTGVSGIALRGGNEISPGLKDFDELAEILEILELED